MTIATTTARVSYVGDGSTTVFSIPFYFQANADLVVNLKDIGGNIVLQTLGTNYTLTGATLSAGGTCTFIVAPPTGYTITIYRDPPITQTTSYNNNDPFPAKSHELALDKAVTIDQRTRDMVSRAVHLNDADAAATMLLPTLEIRKGKVSGYSAIDGSITVSNNTLATLDSVLSGALATSGGFNRIIIFGTKAALTASTPFAGAVAYLEGFLTAGDNGAGIFVWNASSVAAADGSSILIPDAGGTGRWIRNENRVVVAATKAALTALTPFTGAVAYMEGFAAPGDGGQGFFVWTPSSSATANVGTILQPDAGGAGRWIRSFTGPVLPQWFGVKGDGATDDAAAFALAIAYCVANSLTLGLPDATYAHATMLTWAWPAFKAIALGSNCTFLHTGTGVAHNFNGLTNGSSTQGVFKNVFGGANRIILKGNPAGGTTQLVYINNWQQSEMKIRGRDAQYIVYGENTGLGQAAAVSSTFDIEASANGDLVGYAVVPDGLHLSAFFGCVFEKLIVEQCGAHSAIAVQLLASANNLFRGGTIESNLAGGLLVDVNCFSNVFQSIDFEANGTTFDLTLAGRNNTFQGVTTASTTAGTTITGTGNLFQQCTLQSANDSGTGTTFNQCVFNTAFTQGGSFTSVINSGQSIVPTFSKFYLGGVQIIAGAGAPTLGAPQGSLYLRTDGSTTTTRMYININGSSGAGAWTTFTSAV